MTEKYPDMLVGAGTVLTTEQVDKAVAAGAKQMCIRDSIMFAERYPELDFSYTTDPKEAYQDMDFKRRY